MVSRTLGHEAMNNYVKGIIDLYKFQKAKGLNSYDHPRGLALNSTLKSRETNEAERKRKEYLDRGIGTLLDGYSEAELLNFVRHCWTGFSSHHRVIPGTVESFLRTATDFLWSHHTLVRGETRRNAQLPDLFSLELKNEGPTPCTAMIMLMNNGKTNKSGRTEYNSVVRHKNPLLCTLSQTAFYFFYRWDVCHQPAPRFQRRTQWYTQHLLRGKEPGAALSYEVMLEWINKVFKEAGLHALKKTHAGRKEGSQVAEMAGVGESEIRRAGHWNSDSMSTCYLSSISRPFVRGMAGFAPATMGNYYLPRAKVLPPTSLVHAVWPWVDQWLTWFAPHTDPAPYDLPALDGGDSERDDLAGQGFLRLLKELRTILLQDSVLLRKEFPQHPIWQHPVFAREDYLAFVKELQQSLAIPEPPEELRIQAVLPDIATKLKNSHEDIVRTMQVNFTRQHDQLQTVTQRLDDMLSGRIPLVSRFEPGGTTQGPRTIAAPTPAPLPTSAVAAPFAEMVSSNVEASQPLEEVRTTQPAKRPPLDRATPPPQYQMSRTICSVKDLWREWTEGLGNEGYAVRELEEAYGVKWRPQQAERVFFGRRLVIIQELQRRIQQGEMPNQAVEDLEYIRQHDLRMASLDKLSKHLKNHEALTPGPIVPRKHHG